MLGVNASLPVRVVHGGSGIGRIRRLLRLSMLDMWKTVRWWGVCKIYNVNNGRCRGFVGETVEMIMKKFQKLEEIKQRKEKDQDASGEACEEKQTEEGMTEKDLEEVFK